MNDYSGMFIPPLGTVRSRLTDALRYENTGSSGTVRVSTKDLRELLIISENYEEENCRRQMDLDLRSDPEILNIPDPIEKERRIKEKMNFKEIMK